MRRKERVASVLAREISHIVAYEIKDPRVGFVTITEVVVNPDLKAAVVFFSTLGDKSKSCEVLKRAKGYIRSLLAQRVRMKAIPDLEFKIDNSYEYREKINKLFEQISQDNQEE
jgi:ribosome-binding factor A